MKAMIFAAGLGTRLGDITRTIPKALVEVGGEPMLKRVILKLRDAGIRYMVVNVHHHARCIIDYLAVNDNFGIDIRVSDESGLLLDTGGGLLKARPLLDGDEPILVHNADILTDFDIPAMQSAHEKAGADATLLVASRQTSRYLLFDGDMRMVGWENVKTGEKRTPFPPADIENASPLAFGGVHIVSPAVFPRLAVYSSEPKFSITPFYTDECARLDIRGYTPAEAYSWIDIGKPDSLTQAESIVSGLRPTRRAE